MESIEPNGLYMVLGLAKVKMRDKLELQKKFKKG